MMNFVFKTMNFVFKMMTQIMLGDKEMEVYRTTGEVPTKLFDR